MMPLEILAAKLPSEAITNEQRQLAIAEIEQQIMNYCHINAVPSALCFVVASMAADLLRYETEAGRQHTGEGAPQGSVTALSEGDTSVSFGKPEAEADRARLLGEHRQMLDMLILNYREQLQAYRKLRWPSCKYQT